MNGQLKEYELSGLFEAENEWSYSVCWSVNRRPTEQRLKVLSANKSLPMNISVIKKDKVYVSQNHRFAHTSQIEITESFCLIGYSMTQLQ